jgi:hypothetical protein
MDIKTKVKLLVQQVVEAYIKEQLQGKRNQSIAILLGYQSPNVSEVLKTVTPLVDTYDVTLLLTKEWVPVLSQFEGKSAYFLLEETDQQKIMSIVENTSLLAVPSASYRLLSKLALTMDDDLAVWVAIQYQLVGKPIVIANNNVEPTVYQQLHSPHTVQERLQSYIRQVRSDQVKWIPLSKLHKSVEQQLSDYESKKSIILAKHIEQAEREGLAEIIVPKNSQTTPSAKDLARELKIQIKQSSKGG